MIMIMIKRGIKISLLNFNEYFVKKRNRSEGKRFSLSLLPPSLSIPIVSLKLTNHYKEFTSGLVFVVNIHGR